MDLKSLKSIFSTRIIELRRKLGYSTKNMGNCLNASQTSYRRYEQGKILPGYLGLYSIAEKLGISLDWLVCGKGPVYYKEKETKDLAEEKKETLQDLLPGSSQEEIKDLLGHMNRIPLLRHEILAYFYKFKSENKELVAEGMAGQG
jgi:transcriptional regulator with XRE-family HTH domain